MTTGAILIIGALIWLIAGAILHKLANRAGYSWGYYPGAGWLCRLMVIVQAPAVWLDQFWLTSRNAIVHGDEWEPIVLLRMYWEMLKKPALSPDEAFNLVDERDGRR